MKKKGAKPKPTNLHFTAGEIMIEPGPGDDVLGIISEASPTKKAVKKKGSAKSAENSPH